MAQGIIAESFSQILLALIISLFGTIALTYLFRVLGQNNLIGNLYTKVRGGIPRGIGFVPYVLLCIFLHPPFNELIMVIGIFAFLDDIIGRVKIGSWGLEVGQILRGIGMIAVMILGYPLVGYASILVALLVQPMNISDMQPGSTVSVVVIMSILSLLVMTLIGAGDIEGTPKTFIALIILVICVGYSPLDYMGKIMMGEVGNHSFAVALGIMFYLIGGNLDGNFIGGFISLLIFFIITTGLIAFIRRNTLRIFFADKLRIRNPVFGDYFMDVLTGGGLGDLFRRIILRKKQYQVRNPILIVLGFRRLLFNPYAVNKVSYSNSNLR